MAAGEGEAESPPPPPSPSLAGPLPGPERALEEAAASGSLSLAGRRLRYFPGGAARRWDLSDTTQADLSRNRFAEVPEDACQLMSLEGLSLYHNCLRSIPPAIANLQALTYLNIGRNQLVSLPSCLCRLPLRVLIASNNRLTSLPEDLGCLRQLRQLDVGSNELQSLPASVGGLESLRDLSVRKNQMDSLPEELAELPLVRVDFSCNRVTRIPLCFRHLRHLQCILLENNPLQSPPAQVCLKGKIHIFKYLHMEACSRSRSGLAEFAPGIHPPSGSGTCLPEEFYPVRQYGGLDSGFNSVDSGSKRWSGNESTDECLELSLRIAELSRDPRQLKEKRSGTVDASDSEQVDFIDSSVNGEEEEETLVAAADSLESNSQGAVPTEKARRSPLQKAGLAVAEHDLTGRASGGASLTRPEPSGEERRRRPQTLQLWQERERQQQRQHLWGQGGTDKHDSALAEGSSSSIRAPQLQRRNQGAEQWAASPRQTPHHTDPAHIQSFAVASSSPRESSTAQKPNSFLFRSASRNSIPRGSRTLQGLAASQPVTKRPRTGFSPAPQERTRVPLYLAGMKSGTFWDSSCTSSPELSNPLRFCTGFHALDEKELSAQLRQAIESELKVTLADDLGEALANGVVLCQLLNHLRPRSVPFIHVPSPAVPKLNAVKSRKNVESFLTACRQLGIPEVCLCSASDILLQGNARGLLHLLEALLQPLAAASAGAGRSLAPTSFSEHLAGFGVFYVSVMLLLYLAYHKLWGF